MSVANIGPNSDVDRQRAILRQRVNCHFVGPDEFLQLLVSRRRLFRCNIDAARVSGVLEPQTGQHFLIECERLDAAPPERHI